MPKLINRNKQIPMGLRFYIPQLKWQSRPGSFDSIVQSALAVMTANPAIAKAAGWTLTYDAVANMVDEFNAKICEVNGWTDYITTGGGQSAAIPFPQRPGVLQSARNLVAGASTLVEWIKSGSEAVAPELAESRGAVCVGCPKNQQGDLTSIFTIPASNAIRAALNARKEMKLSTTHDEKLGVCVACSCPIPLKLHMKLDAILAKMPKESFDALVPGCWIRTEKK